ncbi:hypothetical protein BDZ97DRAFT_1708710 [Flammula alnicola]|nr:hypothetical protein BDZ97DRAFT_1708710 [Flammula alnicola]
MLPFVPSSFGDIVAAATLALSIYKALSDSTGSSYEYQCLISELRSFHHALLFVNNVIRATSPNETVVQDIQEEAATCLKLLENFWDRIKSYQKALGGGGRNSSWRKIGWGLFKANEVAEFRQKLSQHKQNLTVFLSGMGIFLFSYHADGIRETLASITTATKEITTTTQEILRVTIQKQLPPSLAYGRENAVILINAFGKQMTLPMEFCYSPDKLHDTLMQYFKDKIGRDYVRQHEYSISSEDGKAVVKYPSHWGSVVKKGAVVVMSMKVRRIKLTSKSTALQRTACPRCYRTDVGVMRDEGWLECRRCERRFGWADTPIRAEKPPLKNLSIVDFRNIQLVPVKKTVNIQLVPVKKHVRELVD